ncbi:MAG: stage V sporulation protein AB [Anaerotignum sp.]|nr:stage V sporulation protein AB [Anaerotignum sp.]
MKELFLIIFSVASGLMVSAGVFAFIAAIGIIPRMAWRTGTRHYVRFYEDVIVLGGLFGTTTMFVDYRLPPWWWLIIAVAALEGVFVGVLAMALTEVLNVMPILMRRTRLTNGLQWIILSFALGKVAGSLIYYLVDGFYVL